MTGDAEEDNDAREQIVLSLLEIANEHTDAAARARDRGHLAIASRFREVAHALHSAALAVQQRRSVLFAYELELEREIADARRSLHVVKDGAP